MSDIVQVTARPCQTIKPRNNQRVAVSNTARQQFVQRLPAVALGAAGLLAVKMFGAHARSRQSGNLHVQLLPD